MWITFVLHKYIQYEGHPMICKHCNKEFELTKNQFANHVRWCDQNPKIKEYKQGNINRGKLLAIKTYGDFKIFNVICCSCSTEFSIKEREKLFPQKERYFCSKSCSNSVGGKAKSDKYHTDDVANYVTVAWRYHAKKCIVCDEDKIVAVHHYNENHHDNDPKNLIPLCPTHHQYMHSKYKTEISNIVEKYIKDKWG